MLKLFFGAAGVLFIGLGLFGGKMLEGFSGGDISAAAAQVDVAGSEVTGSATAVLATISSAESTSVSPQPAIPVASLSSAESVVPRLTSAQAEQQQVAHLRATESQGEEALKDAASAIAQKNVQGAAPGVGEEVLAAAKGSVVSVEGSTASMISVAGGDGAEPVATAQPAGDLIAMAEEAKSLHRNEQVNMAKAVLTSRQQSSTDVMALNVSTDAGKALEVKTAIQSTAGGVGNDPLIVIKDKVNLRDGPSIDHPIVLTLEQGQELMEFKREGKWVHVGAYGTSGKIGWVHQRLVGPIVR